MATRLEESTKTAKRLGVGCVVVIIGVLIFNFVSGFFTPEPEPINPWPQYPLNEFGELSQELSFDALETVNPSQVEYKLETEDGKLPQVNPSSVVNVYKTMTPHQSLSALDEAIATAASLGFTGSYQAISDTELKWQKGAKTLNVDKLFRTVRLRTNYANDVTAKKNYTISPDTSGYANNARQILKGANIFPIELENSIPKVTLLKLDQNNNLRLAKSASDANFVRVDFYKQVERLVPSLPPEIIAELSEDEINDLLEQTLYSDVLSDDPNSSPIYVIMGGKGGSQYVYELNYINWDLEESSTYQLVPLEEAWSQVQQNNGTLRFLLESGEDPYKPYVPLEVASYYLTDVEISYYTPRIYTEYIQPLYVFKGIALLADTDTQAEFIIYYPALPGK